MEKKYRLLENDTITVGGRTLYRIEALRDFADVKKGDKGGYVESEDNLSQKDDCWVSDDAVVSGDAVVCGSAWVSGNAVVYGKAEVSGNAMVSDDAVVCGSAWVSGSAEVCGYAEVSGNAMVSDDAEVCGYAVVCGNAKVCGKAEIRGNAVVCGYDYYVGKNVWSSGRYFTYTRSNRMWRVGCFYGTGEELIRKAYQDSDVSGREYKRVVEYVEAMYADLEKDNSKN